MRCFAAHPDFPKLYETYNGRWSKLERDCRNWCAARSSARPSSPVSPSGRVDVLRRVAENEPLYMGLDVSNT